MKSLLFIYYDNYQMITKKKWLPVADPSIAGTERASERTSNVSGSTVRTTKGKSFKLPLSLLPSVEIVKHWVFILSAKSRVLLAAISFVMAVPLLRPH